MEFSVFWSFEFVSIRGASFVLRASNFSFFTPLRPFDVAQGMLCASHSASDSLSRNAAKNIKTIRLELTVDEEFFHAELFLHQPLIEGVANEALKICAILFNAMGPGIVAECRALLFE